MGDVVKPKPYITPLKIITKEQGSVMHGMKGSEFASFSFGEAYFSTVNNEMIKGWKLHREMTMNLIVPNGKIRFVIHDSCPDSPGGKAIPLLDTVLGTHNYGRLTIPPGYWVAFQGASTDVNILLNIADIEHDPEEAINRPAHFFNIEGFG